MSKDDLLIYHVNFILTVEFPLDSRFTSEIGKGIIVAHLMLSCMWKIKMKSAVRTL